MLLRLVALGFLVGSCMNLDDHDGHADLPDHRRRRFLAAALHGSGGASSSSDELVDVAITPGSPLADIPSDASLSAPPTPLALRQARQDRGRSPVLPPLGARRSAARPSAPARSRSPPCGSASRLLPQFCSHPAWQALVARVDHLENVVGVSIGPLQHVPDSLGPVPAPPALLPETDTSAALATNASSALPVANEDAEHPIALSSVRWVILRLTSWTNAELVRLPPPRLFCILWILWAEGRLQNEPSEIQYWAAQDHVPQSFAPDTPPIP